MPPLTSLEGHLVWYSAKFKMFHYVILSDKKDWQILYAYNLKLSDFKKARQDRYTQLAYNVDF